MHPWLERAGATLRTLLDRHNSVGKAYGLKLVPVAIVVDAEGRLVRPVGVVDIRDDAFRDELVSWAESGQTPAAWSAAAPARPVAMSLAEREADARFQLALVLLEAQRRDEALEQLRLAVRADPENWLIRKQMWALEAPAAFYDGPVDYAWQKAQREREATTLLEE